MSRLVIFASLVVAFSLTGHVSAQRKLEDDAFVSEKPTIGDQFPDVVVYAPDGKEVRPSDWKGHHVVLTFGCLT